MTTKEIPGDEAEAVPEGLWEKVVDKALGIVSHFTRRAAQKATTVDEAPALEEATFEIDPRLRPYAAHYANWPEAMRTQYPWASVQSRLLTDTIEGGGEPLLTAAKGLKEAVLFGMDAEGNPMFADGIGDPQKLPHCGLSYPETWQLVRFKEGKDGNQVPTGYQMFPYIKGEADGKDSKSEEILVLEGFTRKPFVSSEDGQWVSSWLESGDNPSRPSCVNFGPVYDRAFVDDDNPGCNPGRGVRRLLRGQRA